MTVISRRIAERALWFLVGSVVTLLGVFLAATAGLPSKTTTLAQNWKYTYGDIALRTRPGRSNEKPTTFKADQVLSLYQGGSERVTVGMDDSGNTTIITFNHDGESIFQWQNDPENRISQRTGYGRVYSGEVYWDLDCDGQYDIKFIFDDNGTSKDRYIFRDGMWEHFDKGSVKDGLVVRESVWLQFEPGKGWVETKPEAK